MPPRVCRRAETHKEHHGDSLRKGVPAACRPACGDAVRKGRLGEGIRAQAGKPARATAMIACVLTRQMHHAGSRWMQRNSPRRWAPVMSAEANSALSSWKWISMLGGSSPPGLVCRKARLSARQRPVRSIPARKYRRWQPIGGRPGETLGDSHSHHRLGQPERWNPRRDDLRRRHGVDAADRPTGQSRHRCLSSGSPTPGIYRPTLLKT